MFGRRFSSRISALTRAFESGSLSQRRAAAKAIKDACYEEKDPSRAVPLLESMLRAKDEQILASATSALCRCGMAAAPVLERMAADSDAQVRERAFYIIGHLKGDTSSLHAMVFSALADRESGVRAQAAFALGRMADRSPATIDALAAAVRDPAPVVRLWALDALRIFSLDEEVSASLVSHGATILAALKDQDSDVRKSAWSVLEESELLTSAKILIPVLDSLRMESQAEVLMVIQRVICRRELVDGLVEQLPALLSAANSNPPAAELIFEICGDLGARAASAVPQLDAVVARPDVTFEAVQALWKITGSMEKCIPPLERLLGRRWFEASRAFELLSKLTDGGRYVIPMLRHAIQDSPDEAAGMICDLGPAAAPLLPELARVIETHWHDPDWDLMWALVDALHAIKSSEALAVSTLAKLLAHPSPRVRSIAAQGLGHAGPSARVALGALVKAGDDEDREVAKAARAAAHKIGRPTN